MAYRRGKSIKDSLVKSDISTKPISRQKIFGVRNNWTFSCLNCISCKLIEKGDRFIHPVSGKHYKINNYYTCTSEWIVYILQCPCNLIYVGETKCDLKTRLNNHRYTIRKKKGLELPVSKHFAEISTRKINGSSPMCVLLASRPKLQPRIVELSPLPNDTANQKQ